MFRQWISPRPVARLSREIDNVQVTRRGFREPKLGARYLKFLLAPPRGRFLGRILKSVDGHYVDAAPALSLHLRDDGTQEETGLTTWRWAQRGHVLRRITYNPISVSLSLFPFSLLLCLSSLVFSTSSFCSSSFLLFIFESSLLPRTQTLFPSTGPCAGRPLLRHRRSACRPSF